MKGKIVGIERIVRVRVDPFVNPLDCVFDRGELDNLSEEDLIGTDITIDVIGRMDNIQRCELLRIEK